MAFDPPETERVEPELPESRTTEALPIDRDSLLSRIIKRNRHRYAEFGMWIGVLVLAAFMVCTAHALDNWLPLGVY